MKSKRKFVLAGLVLLAAIITGLTLTGCETEVDPSTPQQEQPDGNTGNSGGGNTQQPGGDNSGNEDEVGGEKPVTYTVTFNANGGTGTMESQTFTAGTTQPLSANEFQRSGWAFNGWNTMADGSGASYADKASFTATEDTTLYAKWTPVYTVTFNANGGTGNVAPQPFAAGVAQELTANGFTNGVKSFVGWAESADGAVKYTDGQEVTITASITLYARWRVTAAEEFVAVVVDADGNLMPWTDLSAAVSFLNGTKGSTLYATKDITAASAFTLQGGDDFTIDLNGYTTSFGGGTAITVVENSSLTITDGYGGGKLYNVGDNLISNHGNLTILGGALEVKNLTSGRATISNSATMTISGGSITSDNGRAVLCDRGNLILSGNPAISSGGTNPTTGLPYGGIYLPNASSGGSIAGALTMTTPITVETELSNLSAGKWTAFQGTGEYQITDDDLKKLQPIVTDLPASMTSAMGMLNGATLSTALEGNAIVVKVTPKQ